LNSTQDVHLGKLTVLIEPFPPQWKYQDTKMTVQKYRPRAKELAHGLWHWPLASEINKQVCIGKYVDSAALSPCKQLQFNVELQTIKVSVGISSLDTQ
jgi:hypothetical protein